LIQSNPSWALNEQDITLIKLALAEDAGSPMIDATSKALLNEQSRPYQMALLSKAETPIVICGIELVREIYRQVDPTARLSFNQADGQCLAPREVLFTVDGDAKALLIAERLVLNFLQRLCAVATTTAQFVEKTKDTHLKILDTRKTTPGCRHLEKYAVYCGGGVNHRLGLYDAIMIKDNHVDMMGGMKDTLAQLNNINDLPVIVEVRSMDELNVVLDEGRGIVTRVLLDNMTPEELSACVKQNAGVFTTEASGGITLETIEAIANTGVDFASVGALTHSAGSVDLSMKAIS
jgi:nicotinate-nucleotide pyrophosphorylase (carboxylating)